MTLELKRIDDDDRYEVEDVPLTLASMAEFHAELEALIEKHLARQVVLFPGLPREVLRRLIRGSCLCAKAQTVLKEEPQP